MKCKLIKTLILLVVILYGCSNRENLFYLYLFRDKASSIQISNIKIFEIQNSDKANFDYEDENSYIIEISDRSLISEFLEALAANQAIQGKTKATLDSNYIIIANDSRYSYMLLIQNQKTDMHEIVIPSDGWDKIRFRSDVFAHYIADMLLAEGKTSTRR